MGRHHDLAVAQNKAPLSETRVSFEHERVGHIVVKHAALMVPAKMHLP